MFFRVENIYNKPLDLFKVEILHSAKRRIMLYKLGPKEKILSQYLIENYKLSLKLTCLTILSKLKLMKDYSGNLILVFQDKQLESLAKLITFGDGKLQGSAILQFAFHQNEQRRLK